MAVRDTDSRMTTINQRNYDNPALVREYLTTTLRPAEVMMFVKYQAELANRRILEIGCGAGRVTTYLTRWTQDLTAIDFSGPMIEYCARTFPRATCLLCDARDLTRFGDASFEVVLFTFNGIDTLGHLSRIKVLDGVHRVLSSGGLFIFSSHNRRYRQARLGPRVRLTRNPFTLASRLAQFARATMNRRARKPLEREETEYALVNDNAHDYSMLHYYIDREAQQRQLAQGRFELLEVYGEDGGVLGPADDDAANGELYYVARRI